MREITVKFLSVILAVVLLSGCADNGETSDTSVSANTPSVDIGGIFHTPLSDSEQYSEDEALVIDMPSEEIETDENLPIEAEYQPVQAVSIPETSPDSMNGRSDYDPMAALAFAKENWDSDEGLCAEFGSNCLKAGGIDECWSKSSTQLYNSLIESGEGFAVKLSINEDGTVNLPEYAFPGDLVFYYCAEENCMVHTLIYCGDSKKGTMKALAHNPANSGTKSFKYRPTCTEGCDAELNDVVLFCFYRNPDIMKAPEAVLTVSAVERDGVYMLNWEPDFLYKSSSLVLLDKNGEEIYRKDMGTDTAHRLSIKNTAAFSAYVEFTVCDGVTVTGKPVTFVIGSDNTDIQSDNFDIVEELPNRKPGHSDT